MLGELVPRSVMSYSAPQILNADLVQYNAEAPVGTLKLGEKKNKKNEHNPEYGNDNKNTKKHCCLDNIVAFSSLKRSSWKKGQRSIDWASGEPYF